MNRNFALKTVYRRITLSHLTLPTHLQGCEMHSVPCYLVAALYILPIGVPRQMN